MANVTEMPTSEAATESDIPAEFQANEQTPTSTPGPPVKHKGGRGNKKPPELSPAFFKRVAAIEQADWGTRAFMYLYITEPVCVAKTWGANAYALKSSEAILDLEPIKHQFGSCRGWLSLNTRKTGKDATDQIDRYDFEILDPTCPPKIARGAWANDSRNDRWKALLPPEPPPPNVAAAQLLDSIKVYKEIRDEVKEERAEAPAQTVVPPTDPWTAAEKILNMRSENPMMEFVKSQMSQMHTSMEAERERQFKAAEEARKREFDLQQKLMDAKLTPAAAPAKGFFESLIEFGGEAIKTRLIDSLFGKTAEAAATTARPGRMNTFEFISDLAPKAFETFKPLIDAAAYKWTNAPTNGANPGAAMQPPAARPPQNGGDPFARFLSDVVNPKMLMYFETAFQPEGPTVNEAGESFADWIYAGFPEYFKQLQEFTHPMLPGLKGAGAIVEGYKHTASIWPKIANRELQFIEFVKAFCDWKPDAQEGEPDIIEAEAIDLDAQEERIS